MTYYHRSYLSTFRSQAYLDWVKSLPSVVSGQKPAGEAHHIKGRGFGGSVKSSDLYAIPLTRAEHRALHSMGWESWEAAFNVNQVVAALLTIERAIAEGVLTRHSGD